MDEAHLCVHDGLRNRRCGVAGICGVEGCLAGLVLSFSSTVTGLKGHKPVARQPARMLDDVKAFVLARMYISVHAALWIRPG